MIYEHTLYNSDMFLGQIRHESGRRLVTRIFRMKVTSLKTETPCTPVLLKHEYGSETSGESR